MKFLLPFGLLLFSLTVSAGDVVSSLKELFREGSHIGVTPENDHCLVHITYPAGRADILAVAGTTVTARVIYTGTNYRFNAGRREFLSSDNKSTFRTLAVDEVQTYTVTAAINENGKEDAVECIIAL